MNRDMLVPADPPSPLTAEEAVEKALLYTFNWSDKQYAKMRGALTERAFIRALEQDGYTVATLDAARAPDAGLRAALERAVESCYAGKMPEAVMRSPEAVVVHMREVLQGVLSLASSPAPAGLDDQWGALLEDVIGLWSTGQPDKDDVLDLLAEYRAATRPAEDGEKP